MLCLTSLRFPTFFMTGEMQGAWRERLVALGLRVEEVSEVVSATPSAIGSSAQRTAASAPRVTRRTALWTGGVVAAGALGLGAARFLAPGERPVPRYRLIPTWGDRVTSAVLHPDGRSVVYAAAADGKTTVFQQDLEGGPPRSLPLPDGSRLMANLFFHRGRLYIIQGMNLPSDDVMSPAALRFANSVSFFAADGSRNFADTFK